MVMSLFNDFGTTGFLLLLGYLLRKKIPLLQRLFLPASLIGGIVGVLLGPSALGSFCPIHIRFSEYIGQTALPLLACVFGMQMFMIKIDRDMVKTAIHGYTIMSIAEIAQVIVGILLVRMIMPGANDAYGMLPMTSFAGGPGVCAVVAGIVGEQPNFSMQTATSIGNTYATISIITGTIIGVLIIDAARRRKMLPTAKDISVITEQEWTGFVPESERVPAAYDVTNSNSTNTMALQWAIAGSTIFVGFILYRFIVKIPGLSKIIITIPVMIASFVMGKLFQRFKLDKYVDRKSLSHFASIALDFMITSSVANTSLTIFRTHGLLIVSTSVVIVLLNLTIIFGLGRLWDKKNWIMNGLGPFGVNNGVATIGLALLKIADPSDVTGTIRKFSASIVLLTSTVQTLHLNIVPMWVSGHGNGIIFINLAVAAIFLVVGFMVARIKTSD